MKGYYCFIDFGSTYTKVCVISLDGQIVAWSQASTTVLTDITIGLEKALDNLYPSIALKECQVVRATSSAAGGLRMAAIGLVPTLTAEAANRAALGAGAKVSQVFSFRLTESETRRLEEICPDIILLAGGTDGGNSEVIIHNAKRLATLEVQCPIVAAGNKEVAEEVKAILTAAGRRVYVAENVMPEIGKLAVESARESIREVFLEHIIQAKGLDKAKTLVDEIIMPTPMAVLKAATLLAEGTCGQKGMGEVIVVDVGGATTDIHSAAQGNPVDPFILLKGLPEPFAKRTVEGDLGIRVNALAILRLARNLPAAATLFAKYDPDWLEQRINYIAANIETISREDKEKNVDSDLARAAVIMAMNRHAGHLETIYTVSGPAHIQIGKDLTRVRPIIGTGGIFAHGDRQGYILEGAKGLGEEFLLLKPKQPEYFIDRNYILFAAGLLSELDAKLAWALMNRYVERVEAV